MKTSPSSSKPESRPFRWAGSLGVTLIGGLTLFLGMVWPQTTSAQDLLRDLALSGLRIDYANMDPHCLVERQSGLAIALALVPRTPPPPDVPYYYRDHPPALSTNVRAYPGTSPSRAMAMRVRPEPPAGRRSVDVRVRPEPVRKPVGTWTSGGYVLNGSVPVQQPVAAVIAPPGHRTPSDDYSPTQAQLKKMNR